MTSKCRLAVCSVLTISLSIKQTLSGEYSFISNSNQSSTCRQTRPERREIPQPCNTSLTADLQTRDYHSNFPKVLRGLVAGEAACATQRLGLHETPLTSKYLLRQLGLEFEAARRRAPCLADVLQRCLHFSCAPGTVRCL